MSNLAYMVWFVGTALGIIAIVTTGTLAAAGILTKPRRATQSRATQATPPQGQRAVPERHEGAPFGDLQTRSPLQG